MSLTLPPRGKRHGGTPKSFSHGKHDFFRRMINVLRVKPVSVRLLPPALRQGPKSSENVFLHQGKAVCFPLIFPEEQDGFECGKRRVVRGAAGIG